MKILLLADVESKYLWDYFEKEKLDGIDLIISCGDLKAEYLSFLATFTTAPVLYVHGNHDVKYDYKAPDALDVLKRFLTATAPYINAGVSIGGDLGVDYSDVLRILDELGIGIPQTKAMKEEAKQSVVDMKADAVEAREDTQQVRRDAVEARNEVLEDKKQMRKDKPEIEMAVNREPREEAVVIGYGSMKQQDGKVFDILKKDKPLLRPLELKSNMRPAKGVEYAKPDPLVILDGVEYTGTLDKIDANKIESMSILKDERAEDIYGSKAAGGVILITTKRVSK